MVGTIKHMLSARIKGLDLQKEKWVGLLPKVVNQYNNQVHSVTGVTPVDACKAENRMKVWVNIKKHSVFKRSYEPLKVGDSVRTYEKKTSFSKGSEPRYSEKVYKVTYITKNSNNDEEYLLDDYSRRKVYLRHELRMVKGNEDANTMD